MDDCKNGGFYFAEFEWSFSVVFIISTSQAEPPLDLT